MTTEPIDAGSIASVTMPPTAISLRPAAAALSRSTSMAMYGLHDGEVALGLRRDVEALAPRRARRSDACARAAALRRLDLDLDVAGRERRRRRMRALHLADLVGIETVDHVAHVALRSRPGRRPDRS